jgi:hypothetical protein
MRMRCHGWLTPAALGCTRTSRCKCALVHCNGVSFPTAGLTPAALPLHDACRCEKRDLFNAQANDQPRAAGVSPPWFRDTNVVQRETRFVQRLANGRTRAAGVSPPWFGFALATATGFFGLNTSCAAHADAVPRLAYASRSWLHAHKSLQMRAGALQRRFVCQPGGAPGWLTPAALVLHDACSVRDARRLRRGSARRGSVRCAAGNARSA